MEDHHPSLLLLPPPPHPANHAAVKAAYEPPLRAAISKLKNDKNHGNDGSVLFVGLVSPILTGPSRHQKSLSWPNAQSVLAGVYSIVALICTQLSIPSETHAGPDSIDVRVVLIDHDLSKSLVLDGRPAIEPNSTIVIDLPTFASAYHPWKRIFHVNNEPGYQILSSYLKIFEGIQTLKQDQILVVDGGLSFTESSTPPAPLTETYSTVCLGGTFDHLHPGHKLLLTAAVLLLKVPTQQTAIPAQFIVGITGDELLKRKKYAELIQPWNVRAMNVIEFLASILQLSERGWTDPDVTEKEGKTVARFRDGTIEIHCVVIQDAFGPTITEENMDALVVSGETRSGGDAVNERRRDLGWRELEIFEVDVLDAEDTIDGPIKTKNFATKISSTAIRQRKAETRK